MDNKSQVTYVFSNRHDYVVYDEDSVSSNDFVQCDVYEREISKHWIVNLFRKLRNDRGRFVKTIDEMVRSRIFDYVNYKYQDTIEISRNQALEQLVDKIDHTKYHKIRFLDELVDYAVRHVVNKGGYDSKFLKRIYDFRLDKTHKYYLQHLLSKEADKKQRNSYDEG